MIVGSGLSCEFPNMTTTVAVPLWLFILIVLFAAVTFASHFLFPSVRWFLRRRLEMAVERLNQRLTRPIQPFKLARRTDTIRRLVYDPDVAQAISDYAKETGVREDVVFQRAERYAREIVPGFSAFTYFTFAIRLARFLSKSLYRVRLTEGNEQALAAIPPDATVIFVMNHRSNMDYVLVTWLAAERSALAYAVGEWARVWPLRSLVRALGGYFIRRRYNNPLYRKVLARYVKMATEAGLTQAVFPEGGLSQTGYLGEPKLGLFSYILEGFEPGVSRDVVFVPIALNYDRVMEDRVLIDAHAKGTRRFRFSLKPIYRYLRRQIWQRLTGSFRHYGYAAVGFGDPLSLTEFMERHENHETQALGEELMSRIGTVMPITPVPLLCLSLVNGARNRAALLQGVTENVARANALGASIYLPEEDIAGTVEFGLRTLRERKLLTISPEGEIDITAEGQRLAAFYAASIEHLLPVSPEHRQAPQTS